MSLCHINPTGNSAYRKQKQKKKPKFENKSILRDSSRKGAHAHTWQLSYANLVASSVKECGCLLYNTRINVRQAAANHSAS